jgi:hypothetical protein
VAEKLVSADRAKVRHVTVWNADGSYSGGILASAEKEQELKDLGLFVTGGLADGDEWVLNPATGRKKKLVPLQPTISGNVVSGLPVDATVLVGCTQVVPNERGEIVVSPEHGIAQRVDISIVHPMYRRTDIAFVCEPETAAAPDSERPVVTLPQNIDVMRQVAYREEIGDGNQIDTLVKALAEIIAALPQLDGPAVREAKALIARREAIKAQLPKPKG